MMHFESLDIVSEANKQHHKSFLSGGRETSAVGVTSAEGILECHIVSGNVNADSFEEFVERSLLPHLMPFNGINPHSIVVLDNCSIHHVDHIVNLIEGLGVLVLFLPPYSPDMMPIEPAFSKVKSFLKANEIALEHMVTLPILYWLPLHQ